MGNEMITGDVFEVLPTLEPESFDAILCDPPYLLEFMNRAFDRQHKRHQSFRLNVLGAAFGSLTDDLRAIAWHADWLDLALPLLRPGGRLVAASGSRVYHQLATAAALVGFEVDPLFAWINGQPMAQGLAIDKAIDKAAGAEQPAARLLSENVALGGGNYERHEKTAPATPLAALFEGYSTRLKDAVCPWLMAHRPNVGTWERNAREQGLAGLNVDGGRVPTTDSLGGGDNTNPRSAFASLGDHRPFEDDADAVVAMAARSMKATAHAERAGRYPSNLALSPEAAEELGRQSGESESKRSDRGRSFQNTAYNERDLPSTERGHEDSGTAARFFHTFRYQAKTCPAERLKGCESFFWRVSRDHPLGFERITQAEYLAMGHLPRCRPRARAVGSTLSMAGDDWTASSSAKDNAWRAAKKVPHLPLLEILVAELEELPEPGCAKGCRHRQRYQGNIHPTLKPIELIKYLAKLVLPPDTDRPRRVLVLFAGTGSEVIGCDLAGFDEVVGIEAEPVYVEIAEARRRVWAQNHEEQMTIGAVV